MDKPLTRNMEAFETPVSLKDYEKNGGYQAVKKVLKMKPEDVQKMVKDANLKGRGGAGFPTGSKWGFVPMGKDYPHKYMLCNADEMEPGTFKDRLIMENDPHLLIEGLILSSYAIQADKSYIFLRWAYKTSAKTLTKAMHDAYDAGYLGKNILGSDYSLDMVLHTSAGRYMCGEETGLLNALEGKRATPRAKPPYPQSSGLFGMPSVVNNVETISCVPGIINNGPDWFQKLSLTPEQGGGGTKLYGVSGRVKKPGCWELPMGTPMREIIEDYAGGMLDGYKLRAAIPGGASTEFVLADQMDIPMDFSGLQKVGSRLGTGTMIILDDKTCPVGMVENLMHFFAQESCGWCTPCREGLPWTEEIVKAIEEGNGRMEDLDILDMHAKRLGPGNTFCALAPGAAEPLASALKYFRKDFEDHIHNKSCPWR